VSANPRDNPGLPLEYNQGARALLPAGKIWRLAIISHSLMAVAGISVFLIIVGYEWWNWWPIFALALGTCVLVPAAAGVTVSAILLGQARRGYLTRRMMALVWFGAIGNALVFCYLALLTVVSLAATRMAL
jgi:hypothetical protein